MESREVVLAAQQISKAFPGVQALSHVDFALEKGEIHALMGENGAGKSTLIKILTGVYKPDEGIVLLEGRAVTVHSPQHAQTLGISTVYQEVNLIPTLSVAENIFLGRQPVRKTKINWNELNDRAERILDRLEIAVDVRKSLNSYSIAVQQMIAIARALELNAKILILDEPTSSLNAEEVSKLFTQMRKLKAQGHAIIFITHFLDQVYEISDRTTVLRNGELVGVYNTNSLPKMELIAKLMGREYEEITSGEYRHQKEELETEKEKPFLKAEGLGKKGFIHPFNLSVRRGEVVGLAGLLGSGRTEVATLIFGVTRPDNGELLIDGKKVKISSTQEALKHGIGLSPEDRKSEGIIQDLSLRENIILALQVKRGWMKMISRKEQEKLAEYYIKLLDIKTPDTEVPIRNLSGGNQQKAILARWLASDPTLLILDEPTRGIDVGAKTEIQRLVLELSEKGMSLIFISSEVDEVVRCSDRVAVLRDKEKVAEISDGNINEQNIMHAIANA